MSKCKTPANFGDMLLSFTVPVVTWSKKIGYNTHFHQCIYESGKDHEHKVEDLCRQNCPNNKEDTINELTTTT